MTGPYAMDQRATLDVLVTLTQVGETGVIEICGEQATPHPVENDGQPGGQSGGQSGAQSDGETCRDGAVVTVAGPQSCVPTSVDAGGRAGSQARPTVRERITRNAFPALVLLGVGGGLVIGAWPLARRLRQEA